MGFAGGLIATLEFEGPDDVGPSASRGRLTDFLTELFDSLGVDDEPAFPSTSPDSLVKSTIVLTLLLPGPPRTSPSAAFLSDRSTISLAFPLPLSLTVVPTASLFPSISIARSGIDPGVGSRRRGIALVDFKTPSWAVLLARRFNLSFSFL